MTGSFEHFKDNPLWLYRTLQNLLDSLDYYAVHGDYDASHKVSAAYEKSLMRIHKIRQNNSVVQYNKNLKSFCMKQFDTVPVKIPAHNVFDLTHEVKATYNFDKLYPFLVQPVYPGDTWNVRTEVFMRAMPLLAPLMHTVDMRLYFFFVPNRLIWDENKKDDWKVFITGGEDGTAAPVFPYFTYSQLNSVDPEFLDHKSLLDYMGFPRWILTVVV